MGFHILLNVHRDWGGDGRSLKSSMSFSANLQFALEGNIKLCARSVSQTKGFVDLQRDALVFESDDTGIYRSWN